MQRRLALRMTSRNAPPHRHILELTDRPAFSVQHHPEASPGPQDSAYLFEKFVAMLG